VPVMSRISPWHSTTRRQRLSPPLGLGAKASVANQGAQWTLLARVKIECGVGGNQPIRRTDLPHRSVGSSTR
jgi:hypothetical protein